MRVFLGISVAVLVGCGDPDEADRRPAGGSDSLTSGESSQPQAAGAAIDSVQQPDSADSALAAGPPKEPPCLASRFGLPCADP